MSEEKLRGNRSLFFANDGTRKGKAGGRTSVRVGLGDRTGMSASRGRTLGVKMRGEKGDAGSGEEIQRT